MKFLFSPLEQFQIVIFDLIIYPLTNSNIFVFFTIFTLLVGFQFMYNSKIVPSSSQAIIENLILFLKNLIIDQIKLKGFKLYGRFLITLFILILNFNFIGLVPYTFTVTSHLAISLGASISIFLGVVIVGFTIHKERYLDLFLPEGVPLILQPALIYIEIIGFVAKAISLGVRLSANMLAGHTLLKLTTMLVWNIFILNSGLKLLFFLPFIALILLTGLEIGISLVQAYVFVLLSCSVLPKNSKGLNLKFIKIWY